MVEEVTRAFSRKRYYGKYRGIVRDNNDPEKLGRIRAAVPDILGVEDDFLCSWAYPVFPVDFFGVPDVNNTVYIEFENGDVEKPLYSGCWYGKGDEASYTYHSRVIGENDSNIESTKGTDSVNRVSGDSEDEPEDPYEGEYPKIRSYKLKSGLIVEIDETNEEGPRLHIWHPSGKFFEMHPDGSLVTKTSNDFSSIEGNKAEHITGDKVSQIDGDESRIVSGTKNEEVAGLEQIIKGSASIEIDGQLTIEADRIVFNGGGGQVKGVITEASICPYTGAPHTDGSDTIGASK